jgi:predicted dehydrogenase
MKIGIIGCGLMGRQRARSLALVPERTEVVSVFDPNPDAARALASELGCKAARSVEELLSESSMDVAIVAVPHFVAKDTATLALQAGKHVLCEKPLGLTREDAESVVWAAQYHQRMLTPGFNYRFYPGFRAAHDAIQAGDIGHLTHIRVVLGHGARPGYEREWKTSKELCGGGALLDPGIHMIDLIRMFAGEVKSGSASLFRSFWDIDVEDNAMVQLEAVNGCRVQLHISITEWPSQCLIELFGQDGCIQVRGRGGFYGAQTMRLKKRWDWLEPREPETIKQFPLEDTSFASEMSAFFNSLAGHKSAVLADGRDGVRAMEIISDLYDSAPVEDLRNASHLASVSIPVQR